MLKSMTGYGKAQCLIGADKYLVEIRSVNGKTADITFKTQLIPRDREPELRKYIAEKLNRGNIDLFITVERGEGAAVRTISRPTLLAYYEQLNRAVQGTTLACAEPDAMLSAIMRLPDVLTKTETEVQLFNEDMVEMGTPWTWSNGNVFGLGNLSPSTNYYVSLRGRFTVGNETYYSAWTNPVPFTTPAECPAPTNLQVTNVGPFSANLGWSGDAESYEVEYREVLEEGLTTTFEERFNSISSGSLPSNWIILNSGTTSASWRVINQGNSSNPYANGGKYGSIVSEKQSSATATSYFLMPVDDLHGELTFYAKYQNSAGVGARRIAVYYTNKKINPTVSDLTLVPNPRIDLTTTFGQYTVDLSAYQGGGYIAIGHIGRMKKLVGR